MIIIADSHVSEDSAEEFFRMLELIEKTEHPVVFLGDIFDLWISIPRYEKKVNKRFLNWCRKEKNNRTIGLVEGNHDFFVAEEHGDCFTWVEENEYIKKDVIFIHGDLVNEDDKGYRLLRFLSKNLIMKTIFRFLPMGHKVIKWLEEKIGRINPKKRYTLPEEFFNSYAEKCKNKGINHIMVGHFHQYKEYALKGIKMYLLPDWMNTKKIALFDMEKGVLKYDHYEKVLGLRG